MLRTLTEKILARASGGQRVSPGEIVTCRVDLALLLDSGGPRRIWPRLKELGVGVWDPDRIVLCSDHFTPAVDAESAAILKVTRDFARTFGIRRFFDMQGIGHVLLAEQGLLEPGMFAVGGDSHSSMGGAFGCFMAGFGAIEMTGVAVTGEIWIQVPDTVRINWSGAFAPGVVAKDIVLFLCRELGMENSGHVLEYGGDTVRNMSIWERMVLTNMAAELGAETGLVETDETTLAALRAAGREPADDALDWRSDAGATYAAVHGFSATGLQPQVAAPHSPANSGPVGDFGAVRVDQAYIGACVGAKLTDLHMVAEILRNRT
ncbi:MAG: aconitase family protein, partial [Gammaproteobacteria bacterium]